MEDGCCLTQRREIPAELVQLLERQARDLEAVRAIANEVYAAVIPEKHDGVRLEPWRSLPLALRLRQSRRGMPAQPLFCGATDQLTSSLSPSVAYQRGRGYQEAVRAASSEENHEGAHWRRACAVPRRAFRRSVCLFAENLGGITCGDCLVHRRQRSLSLRPLDAAARHQHRLHPGPRIAVSEAQHAGQRGERGARGGGPALWREVDLNCRGRSRAVGVRGGPAAHAPPADTIVGACDDERATGTAGAVRGALHQAQAPEGARLRVVGVGVQAAERERAVTGRSARPQRGREAEAGPARSWFGFGFGRGELRRSRRGQRALRRRLSALKHASGCPELRPASADSPLGPRHAGSHRPRFAQKGWVWPV